MQKFSNLNNITTSTLSILGLSARKQKAVYPTILVIVSSILPVLIDFIYFLLRLFQGTVQG